MEQILAEVRGGDSVGIIIVTNQDDGIVSYAKGIVTYHPASSKGMINITSKLEIAQ